MISDGSCDTEDWSNDAENSAFEWWCKACFHLKSRKKVIVKGLNTILVFMNYKDAAVRYKDANNSSHKWDIISQLDFFWLSEMEMVFHKK